MEKNKDIVIKGWFALLTTLPVFILFALTMIPPASATAVGPNCRYGVSDTGSAEQFDDLQAGWAINFLTTDKFGTYANNIEYVPVIRLRPNGDSYQMYSPVGGEDGLATFVQQHPGRLWLVGNEVDRKEFQDSLMPDVYAQAYHDIYTIIKANDPTAQVGISGLVLVSAGRLQYLDLVWQHYLELFHTPMPVDVWNMHAYYLPEKNADGSDGSAAIALGTDPDLATRYLAPGESPTACDREEVVCIKESDDLHRFTQQVVAMRQWMKAHGQQEKPLILSEYSLLAPYIIDPGGSCFLSDEDVACFEPQRVSHFMTQTFDYLENATDPNLGYSKDGYRLIQRWLWYTSHVADGNMVGSSSTLFATDNPTQLTLMGETYRDWVAQRPTSSRVVIDSVLSVITTSDAPAAAVDVPLTVRVRNNGTEMTSAETALVFRDGAGNPIGTATVPAGLRGCTTTIATATIDWTDLSAGAHPFTVHVDDSNTADQTGASLVLIDPAARLYLPVVNR